MNASMHPTIDQLADQAAGLSPVEKALEVSAHLADCSVCRRVQSRLSEVSDLLRTAGQDTPPIPLDVASAIHDALGRAVQERAAGVTSLDDRRTPVKSDPQKPSRRRGPWLVGAAAAIAAIVVGGAIVGGGLPGSWTGQQGTSASAGNSSNSDFASGDKAVSGRDEPNPKSPAAASPTSEGQRPRAQLGSAPRLSAGNVSQYAVRLAAGDARHLPAPTRCGLADPAPTDGVVGQGPHPRAFIAYDGLAAVLQLDQKTRRLTVFACPGPTRVLYESPY